MNLFIMLNISSRISKYSILFVMKLQKFVTMFFLPLAFLFSTSLKRKHDLQLELNEEEEMIGPFPPKTKQKNLTTLYLATPLPKEENLNHLGACWLMSLVVGDKICGSILCYILISWGCLPFNFFKNLQRASLIGPS
jgi:membrane protein insertase Oxa1/YidC/SpoIIIJ